MTGRSEILDTAKDLISGDRDREYGSAADNFARIGKLWEPILGVPVPPEKVALCMGQVKVARLANSPSHVDSWVDGAGYMALGGEIATKRQDLIEFFHRDLAEDAESVVEPEKTADAYNTMNPMFAHKHFGFPESPACWEDATAEDGSRWVYRDTSGWGVGYWEKIPPPVQVGRLTESEQAYEWENQHLRMRWRNGQWQCNELNQARAGIDGWVPYGPSYPDAGPYTRVP